MSGRNWDWAIFCIVGSVMYQIAKYFTGADDAIGYAVHVLLVIAIARFSKEVK